jgi:hypothetical protein
MNTRSKLAALLSAAGLGATMLLVGGAPVLAVQGGDNNVTLCHRTASNSNPYVTETVDAAAIINLPNGHKYHDGPVWFPGIVGKWGDIIPPFDFGPGLQYEGKNWDSEGQAIYQNDCAAAAPAGVTVTTEVHDGATDDGAPSVIDDVNQAVADATVHDSAMLSWQGDNLPEGSTVTFYYWTNHDCSGEPNDSKAFDVSGGSPASVDPGLSEADLAAGQYSFQAVFESGDTEAVSDASGDCEPFTVREFTQTEEPATEVPSEPNTATIGGTGTSSPSDSSWLLVAALGVLLASVVVLTPARVKTRR